MTTQRRFPSRLVAVTVIVLIAVGLVAWELYGPGRRADAGVREVAIILHADEPHPPVLYVEKGADYRIAVTSADDRYSLAEWPGQPTSSGDNEVRPDTVVWIDVPAQQLRDGRRLGHNGPVVQVVDNLDSLAARGEVYYVSIIAADDGLIPEQVGLAEGLQAAFGGISLTDGRMLLIEGARLYLPLWPASITQLLIDVPGAGIYNVVCEEGCDDARWQGALRVERGDTEVPWVEARDTDAAAELSKRAPDFALYDDRGRVVKLSDYKDEKPVFINFWATWCPPCRREMPAMQDVYERLGHEVEILAVNYLESRPQVTAFMNELQLDFPVVLDVKGDVNSRYGVWSYPTSVFVDRQGVVRGRFMGELTVEMMEEFVDIIKE